MLKSIFRLIGGFYLLNLVLIPFVCGASLLPVLTIKAKKVQKTVFSETDSFAPTLETQQQTTGAEALKNMPGVHLVQTGGVGKVAQLFVRGTNPEHVLVLIDGLPAHDPSSPNGAFDFGQLEVESLEKIHVLRGPHTASYGSDAVGGVVQLTTKKGQEENTKTSFVAEGGSFQSYRQSLSFQGAQPYGDFYVQGGHRQTDTPSSVPDAKRTLERQYHPDPYDSQNFTSHCGLNTQQNWRVSLHNRHQRSRSRYANTFTENPNNQDVSIYDLHGITVEGTDKNSPWQPKLQAGYLLSQRIYGQDQPPFSPRSFFKGESLSLQGYNRLRLSESHTLDMGLDHQHQSYQASIPKENTYKRTQAQSHESSFFMGYHTTPHERVAVDLWARGHYNRQFKMHGTHRASLTYHHLETQTDLYVSQGTVIHNPSLFQMFDPESGNRNLRPEKGHGWELGFQQTLCRGIRAGSTFFQTRLYDLISSQQQTPTLYRYTNINKSQTQGLESFIEWKVCSALTLSLNHLYTSAKDLSTNETLFNRPLHKIVVALQWQMTCDCDVGFSLSYDGKQANRPRFVPDKKVYVRGPLLLRATLNYKPARPILGYGHQEFFIRVENTLNRSYEQPAGYKQPGAAFYAGLRLSV